MKPVSLAEKRSKEKNLVSFAGKKPADPDQMRHSFKFCRLCRIGKLKI
jgi:hypothetical protein